jgi:hypothetical protein
VLRPRVGGGTGGCRRRSGCRGRAWCAFVGSLAWDGLAVREGQTGAEGMCEIFFVHARRALKRHRVRVVRGSCQGISKLDVDGF